MPDQNDHHVNYFGRTNFRNQMTKFGIKTDDRRRHMYVIGKTGMGKTTLLENMILDDIYHGYGCCYVDPHGDTAEKLIDYIPKHRINDVVYFNPSDVEFPIGFNMLEAVDESHRHLVASGMMGVFKKIWENAWSSRMEYILNNTILALLYNPGTTLLGINRLLSDADYRKRIVGNVQDPIVKQFWVKEFASYNDKYAQEAVAPIQNKIGQFLSNSVIRNIVAQVKSTIDMRDIMDNQKIFIINLSKGRIGEDSMRLLGGMLITRIQLGAMERVDIPEESRKDFFLYVDEFQNFAVESFAGILSEARKYRLCLIMAHQYIAQLTEEVRDAVFGNVGTMITFRVGSPDAIFLEKEYAPRFLPEDIINLPKFSIYLKLLIDGVTSQPFSAATLPPIVDQPSGNRDKVIQVSRERYAKPREEISEKIMKWTGMGEEEDVEKMYEEAQEKKSAQKKSRKPNFEYDCTRCETKINLPVELDKSRPIYCEDCITIVREQRKGGKSSKRSLEKSERPKDLSKGEVVEKVIPFEKAISLSELKSKEEPASTPEPVKVLKPEVTLAPKPPVAAVPMEPLPKQDSEPVQEKDPAPLREKEINHEPKKEALRKEPSPKEISPEQSLESFVLRTHAPVKPVQKDVAAQVPPQTSLKQEHAPQRPPDRTFEQKNEEDSPASPKKKRRRRRRKKESVDRPQETVSLSALTPKPAPKAPAPAPVKKEPEPQKTAPERTSISGSLKPGETISFD